MLSHFSRVWLFVSLWTVARQAPLSMFSRQEYWSGLPCPPPGDLPNPGSKLLLLRLLCCRQILYRCSKAILPWLPGKPYARMKWTWKSKSLSHVQLFATPWTLQSMEFSMPEAFPFSRGFSNSGMEPRSPALQADSLPAEPQGKPRILEWVAYPFFSRSSWPRNRTRVPCIAGGFFTNWAIGESHVGIVLCNLIPCIDHFSRVRLCATP